MKFLKSRETVAFSLLFATAVTAAPTLSPPNSSSNPLRIWEDKPGANAAFSDLYPMGNGRLGIMFSGNPTSESIKLNENSMWSGSFIDRVNPDALPTVREMQQLVRDGQFLDAQSLGGFGYAGTPTSTRVYDTLGTLSLAQTFTGNVSGYERWLDVGDSSGGVYFTAGGVTYQREYIASQPDDVIAINLKASKPGSLNITVRLDRGAWDVTLLNRHVQYSQPANGDSVVMGGQSPDANPIIWAAGARIVATGGNVTTLGDNILCKGADEATIYYQAWTNFRQKDPKQAVLSDLKAVTKSYDKIRQAHVDDYHKLAGRMSLNLGVSTPKQKVMKTADRMTNITLDNFDPELAALYFQFGRYLLISSSRPSSGKGPDNSLPPNLQGLWNEIQDAPWGGKYTVNINLRMLLLM